MRDERACEVTPYRSRFVPCTLTWAELAVAAASIEDKGLSGDLAGAVQRLADRASRA